MEQAVKVVLYLRYSSDKQNEQSIEGQMRVCEAFCARNGYQIVGTYIDRALSAAKHIERRENFLKMIKDSDRHDFQNVIVYKLDRFARNRYDSAIYKNKLKKNGVRVISATESITDSPEGVILESVLEGMAEFYSLELAQKVTRGMHETALKGNSCGGQTPFGYKIENKKYVLDPKNAPFVREAFERFAAGEQAVDICESFNQRGIRTGRGSKFNKNSFCAMFRNRRYLGIYKHADVEIIGGMPQIIDEELFNTVQKRLKTNNQVMTRHKPAGDFLLAQKLFCGHCGDHMVGDYGTSRSGEKYYYYICPKQRYKRGCDKKPLRKELLERVVVEDALSIFTPETIDNLAEMAIRANEKELEENKIIPALEAELADLEKRTANLFALAEKVGGDSESLATRLKELDRRKKEVEKQLDEAQNDIYVLEKEHVIWWLEKFTQGDPADEHFRRQIIDMLVNSVTVWDEPDGFKITIAYNLTDPKTKTFSCSDCDKVGPPRMGGMRCMPPILA